jgi:hypothetical protein
MRTRSATECTSGFIDLTSNAGLETYPYSPRSVRVTSRCPLLDPKAPASSDICRLRSRPRSLRRRELVVDSPPLSPMLLPPGRAAPASRTPHSSLSLPARPRAEHRSGADANSSSSMLAFAGSVFPPLFSSHSTTSGAEARPTRIKLQGARLSTLPATADSN